MDRVPCGPVSRFGRPSTMMREVVHGTEGVSGGVPSAGARSGRSRQDGRRGVASPLVVFERDGVSSVAGSPLFDEASVTETAGAKRPT